jgi:hypothetical protein
MSNKIVVRGDFEGNKEITQMFVRSITNAVTSAMGDFKDIIITFKDAASDIEIEIDRIDSKTRVQKVARVGKEYSDAVEQIRSGRLNDELKQRIIDRLESEFERYVSKIIS